MRVVGALVLTLSLSGCGTIVNLALGVDTGKRAAVSHHSWGALSMETRIYGGIQNDINGIGANAEEGGWSWLLVPVLALIDFPLSLAADTLTLIYTVPYVLTREEPKPPAPKASSP